jgi:enoyl-CoA hydratase/carnithine racemase
VGEPGRRETAQVTAVADHVRFDVHDGAATIQLNRAEKRNAVSRDMWITITGHLSAAAENPEIRALVVTGLPGVFCAGADLTSVKHANAAVAAEYQQIALAAFAALRDFPRPTLAAIDGLCIGGGCNIALACDVRIAGPRASFTIPAVRHGIVYDDWTIRRLVELVGSGRAAHFLFTAQRIGVERAAAIGLVDLCVDDLAAATASYLADLIRGDDTAMAGIRSSIHRAAQ